MAAVIDLGGEWNLSCEGDVAYNCKAQVPGDVHSALYRANLMLDPYFGRNEEKCLWVDGKTWIFEREFDVPEEFLSAPSVTIVMEDVDLFCTLSINGREVGKMDNRFRGWDFEVKQFLKPGKNTIRGVFASTRIEAEKIKATYKDPYPMSNCRYVVMSYVRSVACHAGWDWGITQMVTGFCGPIKLVSSRQARIEFVYTDQKFSDDLKHCDLTVNVECVAPVENDATLSICFDNKCLMKKVHLAKGANKVAIDVPVENVRLWWPNGSGEQYRYDLDVHLGDAAVSKKIGLRKMEVLNEKDQWGLSMVFRVNNKNIFMKGADWIPCDAFETRQTRAVYADLLGSARDANMNMVRLWGGGQYEHDDFYDLCDEYGILIWHDFMFSCAVYPFEGRFLDQCRDEFAYQLRRLRDYCSIAFWCGDNECIGALNWFPEVRHRKEENKKMIQVRMRLQDEMIKKYDPARVFWPSSPCCGPGDFGDAWHEDSKGDMHNWNVWHENKDFADYYNFKPRFCSEFGYQSFSSPEVALTFVKPEDLNPTSPDFEHHQKNPGGNRRMLETMARYFRFPEGAENILYLSQVQQALAIKTAVEAWRHLQPRCMGTIIWQLNDNWPVASWSSIEYGGKWKHLQYHAKRFFQPVSVMMCPKDGDESKLEVWMVSDLDQETTANVELAVRDFSGAVVKRVLMKAKLPPRVATLVRECSREELLGNADAAERFATLKAYPAESNGAMFSSCNEWFFSRFKECPLAKADVKTDVRNDGGEWSVTLSADKPTFFTWVEAKGIRGEFDDNSFTLLPGEPRRLVFKCKDAKVTFDQFRKSLSVTHLRNTYR